MGKIKVVIFYLRCRTKNSKFMYWWWVGLSKIIWSLNKINL